MDSRAVALFQRWVTTGNQSDEAALLWACLQSGELELRHLEVAAALGHRASGNLLGASTRQLRTPDGRLVAIPQGRRLTLGRSESCDLMLPYASVSPEHCLLQLGPEGCLYVQDCASASGTFVNGRRVETPLGGQFLSPGDVLEVGGLQLRFVAKGQTFLRLPLRPTPRPVVLSAGAGGRRVDRALSQDWVRWVLGLRGTAAMRVALSAAEIALPSWRGDPVWAQELCAAARSWLACPCPAHAALLESFRERDPLFEAAPGASYAQAERSLLARDAWAHQEGVSRDLAACMAIRGLALPFARGEAPLACGDFQRCLDAAAYCTSAEELESCLRGSFVPWLLGLLRAGAAA